jgi:hypothetical protein
MADLDANQMMRSIACDSIGRSKGIDMKTIVQTVMLTSAIVWPAALAPTASAQISKEFSNSKIVLQEYKKGDGGYWAYALGDADDPDKSKREIHPMDPKRAKVRTDMMKRRVLEEYAEFMSPFRLPRTLRAIASDCRGRKWDSPYYSPYYRWMNICYSYVASTETMADDVVKDPSKVKRWIPTTRGQLIAGEFAATVLHETGHALFDILGVPVFGREEDAADQMEAFLALQFGSDIARTIIKADAYYYEWSATVQKSDPTTFAEFSDVHGTDSQRVYNLLCTAYGGQREAFQDMVDSGWLPPERAKNCESEYRRAEIAFRKTIVPFIDQAQMKKVQARQGWFQPAELKEK